MNYVLTQLNHLQLRFRCYLMHILKQRMVVVVLRRLSCALIAELKGCVSRCVSKIAACEKDDM